MNQKTLLLTLPKEPFDVMVTGEKRLEFRKPSNWILSRLFYKDGTKKEYDLIKFVNGYGNDKPYFFCQFKGFYHSPINRIKKTYSYSNGLSVTPEENDVVIILG